MKIKSYLYILFIGLFIYSCGEYDPEVSVTPRGELSAMDVLQANDYSILVDALNATGIDLGTSPVTIFAPTNAAFQKLFGELGVSGISDIDNAVLTSVLQYHVVAGSLLADDLGGAETTLAGSDLNVVTEGGINVNGKASVVDADRVSANGVIHGINQVLAAPAGNIVEIASSTPSYSLLTAAVVRAGLDGALSGTNEFTVLAPNDDAFIAAGFADVDAINAADPLLLQVILSFHVIPGRLYSQQIADGRVASLLGVEADGIEELNVSSLSFNGVDVAVANINATNGVIHGVGEVIFPLGTIDQFLDPLFDSPNTPNDAAGLDQMGDVIDGLAYERFDDISITSSVYTVLFGPEYADFANDEDALAYLEGQIFDGNVSLEGLSNGDKVTALSGASYYMAIDADGFGYVNGRSTTAFSTPGTLSSTYDGVVGIFDAPFVPLPDTDLATTLAADADYDLMSKALIISGRNTSLSSGDNTFFTVSNAEFTSATGLDAADLDPIIADPTLATDELIADLQEVIDRHTISSVNFSVYLASEVPTLTNALGEDIFFSIVDGNLRIVEDLKAIDPASVSIEEVDILYSNGTIHELSAALDL